MLPLLVVALLSQVPSYRGSSRVPRDGRCSSRTASCGVAAPFFEFAPLSGLGMGTACAGTTPSGAKGETLTFTRASVATCLKGNTTTGINNGDMVKLTSGQPAVMPGGTGAGALGLLVEPARTNNIVRSEEFDNAAWSKGAIGVALPTVTANGAVAPDGTTTADRIQFPATTLGQLADVNQAGCAASSTDSASLFITANQPSAGSLSLCMCAGAACNGPVDFTCSTCSFTTTGWTRCSLPNVAMGTLGIVFLGNVDAAAAADVFVWGAQCEVGAYSSSYVPTTSAAVARSVVVASFAATLGSSLSQRSISAAFARDSANGLSGTDLLEVKSDATNRDELAFVSNTEAVFTVAGTGHTVTTTGPPASGTSVAGYSDGTNIAVCKNGSCATTAGAYTLATGAVTVYLGGFETTGVEVGAVVKQVCIDGPLRCR